MKHSYSVFFFIVLLLIAELFGSFNSRAQTTITLALGYRRSINTDWMGYNSANVIRDSMYLTEPHLMANFPSLHPKIIRYPGGGISNWWDWKKGWFVNSPQTPQQYLQLPVKNNGLDSLKKVCNASGATPIFCLNMISSTLKSQLRMLDTATAKGIPVKYVELGNEFYLDDGVDSTYIYSLFPTGAAYGTTATMWIDSIHKHYPSVKVAAIGAFNRNNATRRQQWDTSMYRTLKHQDVITFHNYFSAAAYDDSLTTDTFTSADVPTMLYRPFKMWNIMTTEDLNLVPSNNEVWITEYNLQDHYKPVHGSWAHGLFLATQTLSYLNDSRITHLACHAICGTAVYGAYFDTGGGFHFGGFDGTFVAPTNMINDTCQFWGLTAAGRTMKTLGIATENMKYVSPLNFPEAPMISAVDNGDSVSYPAVYGWMLANDTAMHVIILNLSNVKYTVKTKDVFPGGIGSLVEYYADATLYVDSESNISVKNKSSIPGTYNSDAYSITYMRTTSVPAPPPSVNAVINGSSTICPGDSVQLDAGAGYVDYQWSTGETTQKIWAKNAGDYVVAVRTIKNQYQALDTLHIATYASPAQPKITAPFKNGVCVNGTAELDVKTPDNTLNYTWSNGTTGIANIISLPGYYTVTAQDANGCKSKSDPDTVISLPAPVPVITPANPADACYNVGVTLDGGAGFKTWTWSNATVGETQNFKTSGSYSVTVKDSNNCYGTSAPVTVTVHEPETPTITVTGPLTFCSGTTPTELKTISGSYTYQWTKGGNNIDGATTKKYNPSTSGTFKVIITDAWGCTKKSDGVTTTVLDAPSTNITLTGSKKICEGVDTVTLSAKDCSGCTFQWLKNVVNISGATNQTLKVTYAGDYTYTATNTSGCSSTSKKKTIKSKTCRVGNDIVQQTFALYPNPAANSVSIHATGLNSTSADIVIRNVLGEEVLRVKAEVINGEVSQVISLSEIQNGIYLVIIQADNLLHTSQLVISRQ